ncbi:hypothetical protein POM88_010824 [Heracleum sosnowskyi]|uniref:Serine-threonine/tyrosine-protein kinase catalytic domain-containing protein n=1 Tax=Heracleum sosnowskyi TaxID=360622 RepID=A0AAD8IVH9_9APIA|nr:hypothetical protein POM88_010824 [Heracleum sosnowskyi]
MNTCLTQAWTSTYLMTNNACCLTGLDVSILLMELLSRRGYMPPEYAVDGLFSVKSDVFSFGVLVLEIVSAEETKDSFIETIVIIYSGMKHGDYINKAGPLN